MLSVKQAPTILFNILSTARDMGYSAQDNCQKQYRTSPLQIDHKVKHIFSFSCKNP